MRRKKIKEALREIDFAHFFEDAIGELYVQAFFLLSLVSLNFTIYNIFGGNTLLIYIYYLHAFRPISS